MKTFLTNLRNLAIAGFFFLLPVIVVFVILTKAWVGLTSVGKKIAQVFGLNSFGFGGTTVATGLLLIALCLLCGLLMRYAFLAAFRQSVEGLLLKYLPGYGVYKSMAEEKLQHKQRILPYATALIKQQDYWQPAYIVERDQGGDCVLLVPDIPDTTKGRLLIAKADQIRILSSVAANDLDACLRKSGKGLLSELGIHRQ
ncbi:hypothetical protein [Hypericibacter sp.]|uniref:hypothetical protein n=1 Tax=Hypericibacter sp. TaxID=2705401 RepID=UPI003D6DA81D